MFLILMSSFWVLETCYCRAHSWRCNAVFITFHYFIIILLTHVSPLRCIPWPACCLWQCNQDLSWGTVKFTGEPFEILLQEELAKFSLPSSDAHGIKPEVDGGEEAWPPIKNMLWNVLLKIFKLCQSITSCKDSPQPDRWICFPLCPSTIAKCRTTLGGDVINAPEVQKVVVGHIVETDTAVSYFQSSSWLSFFSGKTTRPNYEADYDT